MFGVCSSNRSTPPVVVVSSDGGPERDPEVCALAVSAEWTVD